MPPFLELAVPAAEEDDGGDGAQQEQQEEEGTLDAVGSQQNEESGGDHGAAGTEPHAVQQHLHGPFCLQRFRRAWAD